MAVGLALGLALGFDVGVAVPFGFAEEEGAALTATVAVGALVASAVALAVGSAVPLPPSIKAAISESSCFEGPMG